MLRTIYWYMFGWIYLFLSCPKLLKIYVYKKLRVEFDVDAYAHKTTANIAQVLFRLSGSKIELIGLENIPQDGAVLFVCNHEGHMDSIIIQAFINKPKGFISIVEILKTPIIRTWMKRIGCVFIDRSDARQTLGCIAKAVQQLNDGLSMVIFPEGKLNEGGPMADFKKGWLRLITRTDVPVVPIHIIGSSKILSKDGSKVQANIARCVIHKPIAPINLKEDDMPEFLENLKVLLS